MTGPGISHSNWRLTKFIYVWIANEDQVGVFGEHKLQYVKVGNRCAFEGHFCRGRSDLNTQIVSDILPHVWTQSLVELP